MASISTRGFTGLCIYLAALLFFINTFTLATPLPGQPTSTPTPHAPCDDVPCIAGCLSDARATQPASCSKNDPAKAEECLCATVASVSPKREFASCYMECGVKEREILTKMCATKHDDVTNDDEDQDNGKKKEHKKIGTSPKPKKHIGGATSVKDIASKDNNDEDDFDEETTVDDSVDDTTDDDKDKDEDDDDDDDDHPIKTPDVVTNINMDKDDKLDDEENRNTVVINRKGDAYSMVASMKWTTIGAVGVAVLVVI